MAQRFMPALGAAFVLPVQTDTLPGLGAGFSALWNPAGLERCLLDQQRKRKLTRTFMLNFFSKSA